MASQSNKNKIYVLHEFGAKGHYRALNWYVGSHENYDIVFKEFDITRKLFQGFISLDFKIVFKQFENIFFLLGLILSKDRTVIVGIAPYDWRLLMYYWFLRKHKYFYHTSNTYWGYTFYPKKIMATRPFSKNIWRKFIENSRGVFCATQKSAQGILEFYKVSRIVVVNHSIVSAYIFNDNEISFKKKSDRLNCLFVGSIVDHKGIGHILKLIKELPTDKFTFSFAGQGNKVELLKEFIEYRKNCCYLGYIKNPKLMEIYKSADVLLMPSIKTNSWEELFGMSIIEAMACGTIPITTDHSGPIEIINNGFSGYLFSEKEYVNNTKEILKSLSTNPGELSRLKENAYNEAKKYNIDQIFKKWNKLLKLE